MNTKFLVGLVAILILAGFLSILFSLAAGSALGLLLLLGFVAGTAILPYLICVQERTAQVVCSRQHNGVLGIIEGPAVKLLLPLREVAGPVIDTSTRSEQIEVGDVLLHNQQPAALRFTATVMYRHAPHTLTPRQLGEHLPILTGSSPKLIRRWTDYYLRHLIADIDNQRLVHSRKRSHLERRLECMLTDRLAQLGIEVTTVQLVVKPVAGLQGAVEQAEQQRIANKGELELLNDLLLTMNGRADATRNLALLQLTGPAIQNGRIFTWLDPAALLSGNGIALGQARHDVLVRPGHLPEFLRQVQTQ